MPHGYENGEAGVGDSGMMVIAVDDLIPEFRDAIERARRGETWDQTEVQRVVSHEFDFLGPYTTGRVEERPDPEGTRRPFLVVSFSPPEGRDLAGAERVFERGTERAARGKYSPAIADFERLVRDLPEVAKYHRALGQARLEIGQLEEAETSLLHSLRLDPLDPDALTLLGNVYMQRKQPAKAIPLYGRSLERGRNVYALSNLGAALAEVGELDDAVEAFDEAVGLDPQYPNAWFGLALALSRKKDPAALPKAISALDEALSVLGKRESGPPVWDASRSLLVSLSDFAAAQEVPLAAEVNQRVAQEEEERYGVPVEFTTADLQGISAKIEYAWVHDRPAHRVVMLPTPTPEREHHVRHELEHLRLTDLARQAGRNRWFGTSAAEREAALADIQGDLRDLTRKGMPAERVAMFGRTIVDGLVQQLYNFPVDLLIETRLLAEHAELRELFFRSLRKQLEVSAQIAEDRSMRAQTPRRVFRANAAMNGASALWFEDHFPHRTDLADRFRRTEAFPMAKRLYDAWQQLAPAWEPGRELDWVDEWADLLRLRDWYRWIPDAPPSR